MRIEEIDVGGFGTLSNWRLRFPSRGLTALYGANGTGKTTLLRFVRGVVCGYAEARQRRLLPPLKEGLPGGSVTLKTPSGRYQLIRRFRADHSDTLAINLLEGTSEGIVQVREELQAISPELMNTIFCVGGFDPHGLEDLVALASQQGIELAPRRVAGEWITCRIRSIEAERADLFQGAPPRGRIAELEQRRAQILEQLAGARRQLHEHIMLSQQLRDRVLAKIDRLQQESGWLSQELHACESDLTEVQDRLWSLRAVTVQEVTRRERPLLTRTESTEQLESIDKAIANAQQVLRDLAVSRMNLSISQAEFAGLAEVDLRSEFHESRQCLAAMEAQSAQLKQLHRALEEADHCLCGTGLTTLSQFLPGFHEQLGLLCRSLGRQQSIREQRILESQRQEVDRCELELTRQIQHLRSRREELLIRKTHANGESLHGGSSIEARYCECAERGQAPATDTKPETNPVPQIVVREKTIEVSNARPGDEELSRSLLERRSQLRRQWLAACSRLRGAQLELEQLQPVDDEIALAQTTQALRKEHAAIDQELADGREQWQSLALLQSVLQRTQKDLSTEIPAETIAEASAFLARMTEGRYLGFRFDAANTELRVQSSTGAELRTAELSRGTIEQTTLCFRLALCLEFSRRGIEIPLILDDVLADSDSERLAAAVEVLVEFAQSHQVIFLTCQERLLAELAARKVEILTLPGSALPNLTASGEAGEIDAPQSGTQLGDRVLPDDPYWLHPQSPLQLLPSLGEQMSRRLGALGIRNLKELIPLDPEIAEIPLDSLQISASALRLWQAEGRLLCCVPHLTGRDAQVLVACGIHSPAELAERSASDLLQSVRRLRQQQQSEYSFPWLKDQPEWPASETVERWIGRARDARSWAAACEQEPVREFRSKRNLRRQPTHQPKRRTRSATIRLHHEGDSTTTSGDWRFYLQHDSPVVDAPSIGPRMAERLNAIGIVQVVHLLKRMAAEIASQLNRKDITEETVTAWQWQASLMCRVPELRGHDAQVLTHCGIFDPETLAATEPDALYRRVKPFVKTKTGQRLLRSSKAPDLSEVTDWVNRARRTRMARAA
jgi:uncharacterized protein YhaN